MKKLTSLLFVLAFAQFTWAEDACVPSEAYAERIELGNGSVMFRGPGIYSSLGARYQFVCESEKTCAQDICRNHLRMLTGVSVNTVTCESADCTANVKIKNNEYVFQHGIYSNVVTEVVCR